MKLIGVEVFERSTIDMYNNFLISTKNLDIASKM